MLFKEYDIDNDNDKQLLIFDHLIDIQEELSGPANEKVFENIIFRKTDFCRLSHISMYILGKIVYFHNQIVSHEMTSPELSESL